MTEKVLVCVAWPYANGPLHLGHIAGSILPPDIFARYHRMRNHKVLMVSGSDQHGTPITVHAEALGVEPEELAGFYHKLNKGCIEDLGIKFTLFTETHTKEHSEVVQDLFLTNLEKGHIYKKEMSSPYCGKCQRFLPDRYVQGTCPYCGSEEAKGDQCDGCGKTLDPGDLVEPRCKTCGGEPEMRTTEHFFFKLTDFQKPLERYVEENRDHWRKNTINYTMRWLNQGLKDRPITRDLKWGVDIPLEGYDDKRIYVWFDAVTGYLACSKTYSKMIGREDYWKEFWLDPDCKSYYFLGKDNVPFHTIIWPSMLMGYDDNLNLPYDVPANEYLMLGGAQFSKSRRHAVWLHTYLDRYDPDVLRFYLCMHLPEARDTDFTWETFVEVNNNVLVATYGNLIHRVLTFTKKNFDSRIPDPGESSIPGLKEGIEARGKEISGFIEGRQFKNSIKSFLYLAQEGNKYFGEQAPWESIKTDKGKCSQVMYECIRLVRAMAVYSSPFMPKAAQRLWEMLGYDGKVEEVDWTSALDDPPVGQSLRDIKVLFNKLDVDEVLDQEKGADLVEDEFLEHLRKKGEAKEEKTMEIDIDYLSKMDLVVAKVDDVRDHPNADKLYIIDIELGDGEKRQIVAGMKPYYKPEELKGKKIVVVANLKPAKLRGEMSQGMLLAAEDDQGNVSLLTLDKDNVGPGSRVK